MALVEIDVLAAMALGLTLDELIMMYEIQFPVLQQNENDTWYDRHGRIVFTCSKGLIGVGVDRPIWNHIREMHPGETYAHTLTSELYAGQTITYEAPSPAVIASPTTAPLGPISNDDLIKNNKLNKQKFCIWK